MVPGFNGANVGRIYTPFRGQPSDFRRMAGADYRLKEPGNAWPGADHREKEPGNGWQGAIKKPLSFLKGFLIKVGDDLLSRN